MDLTLNYHGSNRTILTPSKQDLSSYNTLPPSIFEEQDNSHQEDIHDDPKQFAMNRMFGCGIMKGCLQDPAGEFTVEWVDRDDRIDFIVTGYNMQDPAWLGIGFGKESQMKDLSVVECVVVGSDSAIFSSFARQYSPPERRFTPPDIGLSDAKITLDNNALTCRFRRMKNIEEEVDNGFADLNKSHFILVAKGTPNDDMTLNYHGPTRAVLTKAKQDLSCYQLTRSETDSSGDSDADPTDICNLPPIRGSISCLAYFPMWTFNATRRECQPYIYGGCLGTENLFETEEDCQNTCPSKLSDDDQQIPPGYDEPLDESEQGL